MQSKEKVNKKKKIVNYERAPGICDTKVLLCLSLKVSSLGSGVSKPCRQRAASTIKQQVGARNTISSPNEEEIRQGCCI